MRTSDEERICLSIAIAECLENYEVAGAPIFSILWLPCK